SISSGTPTTSTNCLKPGRSGASESDPRENWSGSEEDPPFARLGSPPRSRPRHPCRVLSPPDREHLSGVIPCGQGILLRELPGLFYDARIRRDPRAHLLVRLACSFRVW